MKPVVVALALVLCAGVAACGDDEPAQVLSETAEKLAGVNSGDLSLRFVATPKGKGADGQIGFELDGPFSVAEPGSLPVAALDYTQIAGPRRGEAKLLSTGGEAFVQVDGKTYELPPERERELRRAKGELRREGGLGMLDIGAWIRRPKLSEGETVDGVATDRVTSELDVVTTLNDLAALSRSAGAGAKAPKLEGKSAKQVERAVRSSRLRAADRQGRPGPAPPFDRRRLRARGARGAALRGRPGSRRRCGSSSGSTDRTAR